MTKQPMPFILRAAYKGEDCDRAVWGESVPLVQRGKGEGGASGRLCEGEGKALPHKSHKIQRIYV